MKRTTLFLSILMLAGLGTEGLSQSMDRALFRGGGFGHFFVGPAFPQISELKAYLEGPELLNDGFSRLSGVMVGGEGTGLMGRMMIGGGGYGLIFPAYSGPDARISMGLGSGYLKVGYQFVQRQNHLLYATAAFGGAGFGVTVENLDIERGIPFESQAPVTKGQTQEYGLGGFLIDPGLGYKFILNYPDAEASGIGGLMVGLDAGLNMMLAVEGWEREGTPIGGPPSPDFLLNPYIRITIGGGGFEFNR